FCRRGAGTGSRVCHASGVETTHWLRAPGVGGEGFSTRIPAGPIEPDLRETAELPAPGCEHRFYPLTYINGLAPVRGNMDRHEGQRIAQRRAARGTVACLDALAGAGPGRAPLCHLSGPRPVRGGVRRGKLPALARTAPPGRRHPP